MVGLALVVSGCALIILGNLMWSHNQEARLKALRREFGLLETEVEALRKDKER